LTLAALVTACNQTTNREPVVTYSEETVLAAVAELKANKLVRSVLPSHGRSVVRFRHVLDETLALQTSQSALLAILLLRGPQTVGELRIRTERMVEFDGLDQIAHELTYMSTVTDPLTLNVGRRPGQKEERWATLLMDVPDMTAASPTGWSGSGREGSDAPDGTESTRRPTSQRLDDLEAEVVDLRRQLAELRHNLGG
jgi:uncharacterized protein YceH (UPF0502 family)